MWKLNLVQVQRENEERLFIAPEECAAPPRAEEAVEEDEEEKEAFRR